MPVGRTDSLNRRSTGGLACARAVAARRAAHGLSPLVQSAAGGAICGRIGVAEFLDGGGSGGSHDAAGALAVERVGGRAGGRISIAYISVCARGNFVANVQVLLHPALASDEDGGIGLPIAAIKQRRSARPRGCGSEEDLPVCRINREICGCGNFRGVVESICDGNRTRGDCQHDGYGYNHDKDSGGKNDRWFFEKIASHIYMTTLYITG